jgi:hypothetical protein
MDRLAFGTDNGQIYVIPALKLISSLLLNNDQSKENFGMKIPIFNSKSNFNFFRY